MNALPDVSSMQTNPKLPEDAVTKSMARPEPFAKPCSIGKPGSATNSNKGTRVRTMNWKRAAGRPRIHPKDKRKVKFY